MLGPGRQLIALNPSLRQTAVLRGPGINRDPGDTAFLAPFYTFLKSTCFILALSCILFKHDRLPIPGSWAGPDPQTGTATHTCNSVALHRTCVTVCLALDE